MEKDCENCKHSERFYEEKPCNECDSNYSKWEFERNSGGKKMDNYVRIQDQDHNFDPTYLRVDDRTLEVLEHLFDCSIIDLEKITFPDFRK